jgi:hypothetical protein
VRLTPGLSPESLLHRSIRGSLDHRAGAASALNIQPCSAVLQTVYVASLSSPLILFTMRKRLHGVPLLAVN